MPGATPTASQLKAYARKEIDQQTFVVCICGATYFEVERFVAHAKACTFVKRSAQFMETVFESDEPRNYAADK